MFARRLTFWVAVGGVAILSNFALELAAANLPSVGLSKFAAFTHGGTGSTS